MGKGLKGVKSEKSGKGEKGLKCKLSLKGNL